MLRKVYGSSIGKIILIGEHSVVYNKPAIAMPFFAAKIDTSISEVEHDHELVCFAYEGKLAQAPESLLGVVSVINQVISELNISNKIKITINSTIPAERGMGSSAAVSASTVRALYNYFKVELSESKLLELVNVGETIVHGNPSGIDSAIVVKEEPLYFIKGEPFEHFNIFLDGYLIVADTGITGQTKFAVSKVRKKYDSSDEGKALVNDLEQLVIQARTAIESKDIEALAKTMNSAQSNLKALGVSNDTIDHLVSVAKDNGALAAKLTGGGLGGCVIALCQSKVDVENVEKALLENGAKAVWNTNLSEGERYAG